MVVVTASFRVAFFPTYYSCICKMTTSSEKSQLMPKNVAANRIMKHNKFTTTLEPLLANEVMKIKKVMATKSGEDSQVEELIMIDAIQRLGLDCYFRDDIHDALERHHVQYITTGEVGDNLHDVALRFRLLRQAGYNVPADIFNSWKGNDGKFKEELQRDTKGLLNLFEASQLTIPGDHILDDAAEFCKTVLNSSLKNVKEQSEANSIRKSLKNTYHKSLPRLSTKKELNTLETTLEVFHDRCHRNEWIKLVQNLARMDVNVTQTTTQNEITQVSRWWKELGLTKTLELVRSQPVKWHMWSLVVIPDPGMAELRIELTKAISLIYLIDDIFDVYGTLEELTLFTEAVNRWDCRGNNEGLPDYMAMCLNALYDTTNEISNKIYIKHGWNPKDYLQKTWAELCNAFLVEARWFNSGQLPTAEVYLKNGIISSGVYVVSANVFCLLGEAINKKSIELLISHSGIVSSAASILRLWDDLGASKDENQDGNDGSYIACYMNQYKDISAESAQEYVIGMISNAWKCLNRECLSHSPLFSTDFIEALLNLARMVPIMYSYDKNGRLPSLEKHMKLLFLNE